MVVVILQSVPERLRGDLTRWLNQVGIGVYVGSLNARVREELWVRITGLCSDGQAVMIWSAHCEQGYEFYVHNISVSVVDFDGLKYLLHPVADAKFGKSSSVTKKQEHTQSVFRKRYMSSPLLSQDFVVFDFETTGLDSVKDEVIEFGALRVRNGVVVDTFSELVSVERTVPDDVMKLTGISSEMLTGKRSVVDVLPDFVSFLQNDILVGYNVQFDVSFLNQLLKRTQVNHGRRLRNKSLDVLVLMKQLYPQLTSFTLESVFTFCAEQGKIEREKLTPHRALDDCKMTYVIYEYIYRVVKGDSDE